MAASKKQSSIKSMTPLLLVAAFLSLTEIIVGVAATQTSNSAQTVLIVFVCAFPIMVAGAFFYTLWHKPFVFYPPGDFGNMQNVSEYVEAMRGTGMKKAADQSSVNNEPSSISEKDSVGEPAITDQEQRESKKDGDKLSKKEADPSIEMWIAAFDGRLEDARNSYNQALLRESNQDKAKQLEAEFAFLRFRYCGDQSALAELESMTSKPELRFHAWKYLGYAWKASKDYIKAIKAFKAAEELADANEDRIEFVIALTECFVEDGQHEVAVEAIMKRLPEFHADNELARLYEGLGQIFNASDDMFMKAISLELALAHKPSCTNLRFEAAWAYAKKEMHHLAILHYDALTSIDKKSFGGFNNLGVACSRLGMPIAAVRNYRKALELNNTLAGANLAHLFIGAGFADDAKKLLDELRLQPDVHASVGSALAALSKAEEDEKEKGVAAMKRARSIQKVLRTFADSYFTQRGSFGFNGSWALPNGTQIVIREQENQFFAEWIDGEFETSLDGHIMCGMGARIKLKKTSIPLKGLSPLISKWKDSEIDGFACLNKVGDRFSVFNFDQEDPSILTFTRVALLGSDSEALKSKAD
jgi:tetratricopeptide (TPR) repeat protein/nitrate reductase NapE component